RINPRQSLLHKPGPRSLAPAGTISGGLFALVAVQQLDHLLADAVQVGAQLYQYLGSNALALADQAQQDMFRADVVVAKLQRLPRRQLHHFLGPRGERDVPGRGLLPPADDLLDLSPHRLQADPQRLQRLPRHPLALPDQPQQDVLGPDVVVVEHPGLVLRQAHNPPRPVGKPLKHLTTAPPPPPSCSERHGPAISSPLPPRTPSHPGRVMIRNIRGTSLAVSAGASGGPRGQQRNSPVHKGVPPELWARQRRTSRYARP